jgi:hypothetical protein
MRHRVVADLVAARNDVTDMFGVTLRVLAQ